MPEIIWCSNEVGTSQEKIESPRKCIRQEFESNPLAAKFRGKEFALCQRCGLYIDLGPVVGRERSGVIQPSMSLYEILNRKTTYPLRSLFGDDLR